MQPILLKTAINAKKAGYIDRTRWSYNLTTGNLTLDFEIDGFVKAPSQTEIVKWLRDIHKIHINIYPSENEGDSITTWSFIYDSRYDNSLHDDAFRCIDDKQFETYEDALEQAIYETLNLLYE